MKQFIALCIIATLSLFATGAMADAKSDYFAAISKCAADNPPVNGKATDARIACDFGAMLALQAAMRAPLTQTPAAKKSSSVNRDAGTGQFTTAAEAKAHPSTTVTETVKK